MLENARVLLVEDDPLVSETISAIIQEAGGQVAGSAASVADARALMSGAGFDVALLDVNLTDGEATPVLEGLMARQIPVVIYTGADLPVGVEARHPDLRVLRKPAIKARLIAELRRATGEIVP